MDTIQSMTLNTFILDPVNNLRKRSLIAQVSKLWKGLLRDRAVYNQGYCQIEPGIGCVGHASGLVAPSCEGDIIMNVIASGIYPYRRQF
jgi:hypothetical protein